MALIRNFYLRDLFLVVFSLSILGEGIGGPLVKAVVRISMVLFILPLTIKKKSFFTISRHLFIYFLVATLPLVFSLFRGTISQDIVQYLMYINCFIFSHAYMTKYGLIDLKVPLLISLPIVLLFFFGGLVFNIPFFWRETFSDNAIRLGGMIINPNELGMLSAISAVTSYSFISKSKYWGLLVFVISIFVLLSTGSRSAIIALLLAIFYLLSFRMKTLAVIGVISILLLRLDVLLSFLPRMEMTQDVYTLTGRLSTWSAAFNTLLPKYWIIGAGFQQFPGSGIGIGAQMAHNTFIQLLIGGGVVVFIIGLSLFISVWLNYKNYLKAVLIIVLINSMTEFGVFGHFNHSILLFSVFTSYKNAQTFS